MAETSQAENLRNTCGGRRFLKALRLVSAAALLFCILSIAADWCSASGNYFEDGATWLYDTAIYGVVAISFGRGASFERMAAGMLAFVLLVAGCQGAWDIWSKISQGMGEAAADSPLSSLAFATGTVFEAALLFSYRKSGEALMQGTWLSARNSAVIALLGAGLSLVYRAPATAGAQICVDCFDTILAFQAAFYVAQESIGT
jgi:hypothetical protein